MRILDSDVSEPDERWTAVLDAMERGALERGAFAASLIAAPERQSGHPSEQRLSEVRFEAPADLGPLPPALRDRATEVAAELDTGIAAVETRLAGIRSELTRIASPRRIASPSPERRGDFEALA